MWYSFYLCDYQLQICKNKFKMIEKSVLQRIEL